MFKQKTIKQLSKLLNISTSQMRLHLASLETYRVPKSKPIAYYYTLNFLIKLKNFYEEKAQAIKYRRYYSAYKNSAAKLKRIINYMQNRNN
jgi:flagellar biosynthesis chaperone FliJ